MVAIFLLPPVCSIDNADVMHATPLPTLNVVSQVSSKFVPQTKLALTGFSRYCPSSVDLTNFVVWRCGGAVSRLSLADSLESGNWESGNPGIWESRNLEIWESGIQKNKLFKSKSVSPKMSAVWISSRSKTSWLHLGPFQINFSMDQTNAKKQLCFPIFLGWRMGPIHVVWGHVLMSF